MSRLVKLLVLLAMVSTTFGMTVSPASAEGHQEPATNMSMQHCPKQAPGHDSKGGFVECTMACSAALPAVDLPQTQHLLIAAAPTAPAAARELHGLHPDTATPPPKAS